MVRVLAGLFIVLHGLVHLLYAGQSARRFELQPGMVWPDGAWAFGRVLGDAATRNLTTGLLALATLGFLVGGGGLLARQSWWRPVVIGAAAFSAAVYLLLWDGGMQGLADKGAVGVLINLVILVVLLLVKSFSLL